MIRDWEEQKDERYAAETQEFKTFAQDLSSGIQSDLARTQADIIELNETTAGEIAELTLPKFEQHVDSICASDYATLTLSVALSTLHDHLSGGGGGPFRLLMRSHK